MQRRLGVESQPGLLGNGLVSRESQKNLEKAEHYFRQRKGEKGIPFLQKAVEDPNNLDAAIQMAFLMELPDAVVTLQIAEDNGRNLLKGHLGADCFDDNGPTAGKFGQIVETRPYMRVLQAIVRLAFENNEYAKSVHACSELLRLNWGDNMGQRDWFGSLLLQVHRPADALSFAQAWLSPEADRAPIPGGGTRYTTPTKTPLPHARYVQLSEWAPGALVYTAALAAFKLWGNCPLACQYLRIAAKVMPLTLIKILARVDIPKSLNMTSRAFNGPEATQDYLFITQKLWMEPSVWAWADTDPEAKKSIMRPCQKCRKVESAPNAHKRCSSCKEVCYCGPACQKEDWKGHKAKCLERKKILDFKNKMKGGRPPPKDGSVPFVAMDFANGEPFMFTGN